MLQQLARTIFGAPNVGVSSPSWLNGGLAISDGIVFPYKRIFIIALVAVVLLCMYLYMLPHFFRTTDAGCHAEPEHGGLSWDFHQTGGWHDLCHWFGNRGYCGLCSDAHWADWRLRWEPIIL